MKGSPFLSPKMVMRVEWKLDSEFLPILSQEAEFQSTATAGIDSIPNIYF